MRNRLANSLGHNFPSKLHSVGPRQVSLTDRRAAAAAKQGHAAILRVKELVHGQSPSREKLTIMKSTVQSQIDEIMTDTI